jgi:PleD family two-component response regulator
MKVFTTGQVARICTVAPRTVSKWFDSGRLKGYRIPGSHDRRIPRKYLIKFLKEHGMPLGDLEEDRFARVLMVSRDDALVEAIRTEAETRPEFKFASAPNGFGAGVAAESFRPDCVLVDFASDRVDCLHICGNLRKHDGFARAVLVAIVQDDRVPISFDRSVVDDSFKKPFDAKLLVERLRTLIGERKELD